MPLLNPYYKDFVVRVVALVVLLFVGILIAMTGESLIAQRAEAEPPQKMSPGEMLGGIVAGVGSALTEPAPIKVQRACSDETGKCWESHGLNKENMNEIFDVCWQEAKQCPQVCKDEYFSRRKAGMIGPKADPLFYGMNGEETSCVPGVDELTHPNGKASTVQPDEVGR